MGAGRRRNLLIQPKRAASKPGAGQHPVVQVQLSGRYSQGAINISLPVGNRVTAARNGPSAGRKDRRSEYDTGEVGLPEFDARHWPSSTCSQHRAPSRQSCQISPILGTRRRPRSAYPHQYWGVKRWEAMRATCLSYVRAAAALGCAEMGKRMCARGSRRRGGVLPAKQWSSGVRSVRL